MRTNTPRAAACVRATKNPARSPARAFRRSFGEYAFLEDSRYASQAQNVRRKRGVIIVLSQLGFCPSSALSGPQSDRSDCGWERARQATTAPTFSVADNRRRLCANPRGCGASATVFHAHALHTAPLIAGAR